MPDDPTTAHEAKPSLGAPSVSRRARLSLKSPHQLVALVARATMGTIGSRTGRAPPSLVWQLTKGGKTLGTQQRAWQDAYEYIT